MTEVDEFGIPLQSDLALEDAPGASWCDRPEPPWPLSWAHRLYCDGFTLRSAPPTHVVTGTVPDVFGIGDELGFSPSPDPIPIDELGNDDRDLLLGLTPLELGLGLAAGVAATAVVVGLTLGIAGAISDLPRVALRAL